MSDEALLPYGWSDRWATLASRAAGDLGRDDLVPGRVLRHDGVAVVVVTAEGSAQRPVLGSVEPTPVVGDWVLVSDDAVWTTLERGSLLRRRDPMRDVEQAIAANVDVVLIVCGLDRPVKDGRIQRATALAWDAGATPVAVLTKADLHPSPDEIAAQVAEASPGVEVIVTASPVGRGVAAVRERCAGQTVVMIGESGAGKSSLANAVLAAEVAAVGAVREGDAKGRHTTTARELHPLPGGGVLIDTPGIRSIGLWTDADAIAATFSDVEDLAAACRFSDCAHRGEPGCAVAAAVEAGDLAPARWEAWRTLTDEVEAAERRTEEHSWRTGGRRGARPSAESRRAADDDLRT